MMRHLYRLCVAGALLCSSANLSAQSVEINGYAEWRHEGILIVDGQRVALAPDGRFRGEGDARSFIEIPLGYEVTAQGTRGADGIIVARRLAAKPNGDALFERDLVSAFDEIEADYRWEGEVYEEDDNGDVESIGDLLEDGPYVDRILRIASRLTPPYLSVDDFRFYVVENEEWNAMAAPNGAIFVFTGLLDDMDDDEVAIILGHELVHATHEHSRRHNRSGMIIELAALGISAAAEAIDNSTTRAIVQVATLLGTSAWSSGYGRNYEDQADRVGLRYAYQAGYDVRKGPALWGRFAEKYGETNRVVNFFFSDHSVADARARNLARELSINYREPAAER
ncbi:MAG: M48 family metalloprotease [Acidobacteria bacterium]|nr:M48 family metalloprotease [Acidobacteriota bacterium]